MANTPQNYLNEVATEESRKHKLFELENRLHKQELYSANTVQKDLNRLIDGWNDIEERLDDLNKRIDVIERTRNPYSRSRSNKISSGRRTRGKKSNKNKRKNTRKRGKSMRKKKTKKRRPKKRPKSIRKRKPSKSRSKNKK